MKVREVMTTDVVCCSPETTLAQATTFMEKKHCGFLPVVGEGGNVIGVLTDRDISIALGTRNERPSNIRVWDATSKKLFTCTATDDVHSALKTLHAAKIRRLPVIDREGALIGVLSIDDIVKKARGHGNRGDVTYKDVEDTYKSLQRRVRPSGEGTNAAA